MGRDGFIAFVPNEGGTHSTFESLIGVGVREIGRVNVIDAIEVNEYRSTQRKIEGCFSIESHLPLRNYIKKVLIFNQGIGTWKKIH